MIACFCEKPTECVHDKQPFAVESRTSLPPSWFIDSSLVDWGLPMLGRVIAGVLFCASSWFPVQADLVRLNNGGEIRGTFVGPPSRRQSSEVSIVTLTGASVVVSRDDLEFATPRSIGLELYESKVRDLPDTVDAHWELAQWCREQKLSRQRTEQLEAVLRVDPDHIEAHKALRHTFQNGRWMTRDQLMTSQGYVRHNRRWVTQQELDFLQKTEAERQAELAWYSRVRLWLGWATERKDKRKRDGITKLRGISDPDAIPALRQFLGEHQNGAVRLMFVRILVQLPGSKPLRPLVERSLEDGDATIRTEAVAGLKPVDYPDAARIYVEALKHDLVVVVRRAALALRTVGTEAVVEDLIDALVTQHQCRVTVAVQDPSYALGSDGSIGYSNNRTLPLNVEAALRTGQLPYGAVVEPSRRATRTKTVTCQTEEMNLEVRATLRELTGQDFGYNERSWHLWWAAQKSGLLADAPQ